MYISKISELAKCYPLSKAMQYDLYRRMQFSTTVNWVPTASSSRTKHYTDQIQLPHRRAYLLAKRPA